jgi:hypothetical protein
MADEEKKVTRNDAPEQQAAETRMRIADQPYVVGLNVEGADGEVIHVDDSAEGVLVDAGDVITVHEAAYNAGIRVEEVSST